MRDFVLTEGRLSTPLRGREVLRNPALNKGVAFPIEERRELGLTGLLPPAVLTLADQAARAYQQYGETGDDVSRAVMLGALQGRNQVLYHRLLADHLQEMLPVVYTPTIGTMIQRYSRDFRRAGGVYLSIDDPDGIGAAFENLGLTADDVDLVVVTDGEGILGIGDWGVGGIAISIGKLAVYTAAGGIDPNRVLPVVLDAGTNNQALLGDPLYVGVRHPRVAGPAYDDFVDAFVQAVRATYPHALLHWEDLGTANATRVLRRYRDTVCSFNDDIQGTGAVVLAAVLAGSVAAGTPVQEHRVVILGAGSAGIGIADQIRDAMTANGVPAAEAARRFWCLGRGGLLIEGGPGLRDFQQPYARPAAEAALWDGRLRPGSRSGTGDLAAVVDAVRPTILIGTSGTPGAFGEEAVRVMGRHVHRPIIMPLSNPTRLSEATPSDLLAWTDGRALVATGSPFPPLTRERITYSFAQANNALVFPGLGLGAIVSRARLVTDGMLAAAASAVAASVDPTTPGASILPAVNDLRAVSTTVAVEVAAAAVAEGVAGLERADWRPVVEAAMWRPEYLPVTRA